MTSEALIRPKRLFGPPCTFSKAFTFSSKKNHIKNYYRNVFTSKGRGQAQGPLNTPLRTYNTRLYTGERCRETARILSCSK